MSAARDAVVADIHRLMATGQELQDQLVESRRGFTEGLQLLEIDTPLGRALADMNSAERRVRMTELLSEFDECRHRLRISRRA